MTCFLKNTTLFQGGFDYLLENSSGHAGQKSNSYFGNFICVLEVSSILKDSMT